MKITEVIEVPAYSSSVRIVDGQAILVAENGNGKTAFLNAVAKGEYRLSSEIDEVYYFGFGVVIAAAEKIMKKIGAENTPELLGKISSEVADPVYQFMKTRLANVDLKLGIVDENFAWRRLALIAALNLIHDERYLLLIDEPELMAHPVLRTEMAVLLKHIRYEGNPVIVATNLDNVVADLVTNPEQIVRLTIRDGVRSVFQPDLSALEQRVKDFYHKDPMLLRRFSGEKQIYQGLKNVVEHNYTNYLGSTLKKQLFDISFSSTVILGEGASEGVLFDYAAEGLYPEWIRKHRVTFINCLGKATMPLFFLFLNELGIRVICMTDYDNNTNRVHNAYRKALNDYEAEHSEVFRHLELKPDLEGYLQINPDYKLEPIEKPVHIYVHTYATGSATNKVLNLMTDWFRLTEEMEGEAHE